MQLDKENIKKIRWLIAFAILLYLGVQNLHIVISTVRVLLGFLFPFIIGFGIAFILNIPMKFIEHHLFGKALKQEKKTAFLLFLHTMTTWAAHFFISTGQPGAFYLLCDLYNRDRYAGSSTGTGGNIRKHSEKDRRKYSGFPEMDRQCIRKQSGSCEMGAVS